MLAFCEAVTNFLRFKDSPLSSGDVRFQLTSSWCNLFPESILAFMPFSTAIRVLHSIAIGSFEADVEHFSTSVAAAAIFLRKEKTKRARESTTTIKTTSNSKTKLKLGKITPMKIPKVSIEKEKRN